MWRYKIATCAALALLSGSGWAQYKCVGADGKVSFQQMPCPGATTGQRLELRPAAGASPAAAPAPAASVTGVAAEMQWVRKMEHERKLKEQQQRISDVEAAIDGRNRRMQDEMTAIQSRKTQAKNNLAGATWEQSLSTEMQAVASKYQALNDADQARLAQLRAELEQMQRAPW